MNSYSTYFLLILLFYVIMTRLFNIIKLATYHYVFLAETEDNIMNWDDIHCMKPN